MIPLDALRALTPSERGRRLVAAHFPGGIGSWAASALVPGGGAPQRLVAAADGAEFATWADADDAALDRVLDAAVAGAHAWAATDPFERARILRAVAAHLERHVEELAILESVTVGKPLRDARVEAAKVAEMYGYYAGWADKVEGRTPPVPGAWSVATHREPFGVVATITPWNAPLFTAGWNSAPGLAAGNAVIVKPSELTPLSTIRLAQLAEEAGLPPGVFCVAVGTGATAGARLTTDPRVGMIGFIGSVPTGRRVAATAGAEGKPVLLELGGKSANIVFADADLEQASDGALSAIFAAAGQSCVAGSRLLVHADVADDLLDRITRTAALLRVGDPLDEGTEIGPIISPAQVATIQRLTAAGTADGGRLLFGADRPAHLADGPLAGGHWVAPTAIAGVRASHTLETSEVFGPVLAVDTFTDEDEVVARANATGFGLAGAVWTRDPARAARVAGRLHAGTVWINAYKTIHVAAPFGGYGASGFGRSSGAEAIDAYTRVKAVWTPTTRHPAPFPSLAAQQG